MRRRRANLPAIAIGLADVTGGDLLGQALAAGLVDELQVDLVQGDRVTHLRYRVRR